MAALLAVSNIISFFLGVACVVGLWLWNEKRRRPLPYHGADAPKRA